MTIWIDAQISPDISTWIEKEFSIQCFHVRNLNLLRATDSEIFFRAKDESAIVMTKDIDFIDLLERNGPPPKIIWITTGNTSNDKLKEVLQKTLTKSIEFLEKGENLVEIN